MAASRPKIVYGASAVAGIGGMLFGYDTGVISGAILFITPAFHLTTVMEETVVSAVLLGAIIGAAGGGILGDRLGRRRTIIAAGLCFSAGTLICAIAPNVWILLIGRLVVGVSIGVASFTVPLYISEIAPPEARGWLVSVNQLALTLGIVISYLTDYMFAPTQSWRWMSAVALPPQDPRVAGTVEAIRRQLMSDGLVRRYDSSSQVDGLPGREGAFVACSFWLVDNLTLLGRQEEAEELFEKLLSLRNDVGLLSEEYDPKAGRQLGNFPQAFSHVALVNSAHNLSRKPGPAGQRAKPHP